MATRTERVRLVLVDDFSGPAGRAAARTELLRRELDGLSHSAGRADAPMRRLSTDVVGSATAFRRGSADIDLYSGRLKLMVQTGAALGPALVPAIAGLVPAVTGLASGMAGAAGAAAAAGLAFAGVGDALGALNDFQLEPTAENFLALQQAMDDLGPSGANFVRYLDSIGGELESLQRVAGDNLFPGMTSGLQSLLGLMPRVRDLVGDLAARMGDLASDAGAALAGEEWEAFFAFLKTDAAPIFEEFSRAAGNVALGLGNLMVAFAPLSRDFASGLLDASRAFAAWSADSSNFTEFIDYVRKVGPQASEFFGALGDAAVALAEAVAPWGSMVLPAMTAVLNVFTAIAGSPIGPALTTAALAMLAFNKAAAASSMIMGRVTPAVGGMRSSLGQMRTDLGTVATTWATAGAATERESKKMAAATGRLKSNMATIGKGAALVGAVGVAASGAADGVGLQNTAMLGLAGTMAGPWGIAAGAAIGLVLDFKAAQAEAAASAKDFASTLDSQTGAITDSSKAFVTSKLDADQINKMRDLGLNIGEVSEALAGGTKTWDSYYDSLTDTQKAMLRTREGFFDWSPLINDLDKVAAASDDGATAFDAQADSVENTAAAASAAVTAFNELTAAQQAQTQAALAGIDAGTAYGAALDKAAKQAEGAEQGFNKFTEAGRNNRTAMTSLVSAYNAQDAATKNSVKGYRDARRELAEVGRGMGLTAERIRELQGHLEKPAILRVDSQEAQAAIRGARSAFQSLPGEVMTHIMTNGVPRTTAQVNALVEKYKLTEEQRTALITLKDAASAGIGNIIGLIHNVKGKTVTVGVDTGAAVSNVRAVQAVINGLSGKTVTITTLQRTVYAAGKMDSIAKVQGKADGGPIHGPGTGTSDDIPIWASNGEFMIRAAAVDKYGVDFFARLNAMQYADGGPIHHRGAARFATGGSVRSSGSSSKSLEKTLERHGKRLERSLGKAEKAVDRARDRLDHWNQKRDEVRSQVTGSLTRDWMGGGSGNIWSGAPIAGTAAFAQQQWKQQATDAKSLIATVANLRKNGAGDRFIQEILGADDPLAAARMFNKQSKAGMRHSQSLYRGATRATQSAANFTSGVVFGDEQAKATRELRTANKKLTGIEKAVNRNHKAAQESRKKNGAGKAVSGGSRARTRSKRG